MSSVSPIIERWIRNKYAYKWTQEPIYRPFTIPAGGKVRIPTEDFIFSGAEGTLIAVSALFDNSHGGICVEAGPNLDTEARDTVGSTVTFGKTNAPSVFYWAAIPPLTVAGTFALHLYKEIPWIEYCRLSVINDGPTPIQCLGYIYRMAYLTGKPIEPSWLPYKVKMLETLYNIFPDLRTRVVNRLKKVSEEIISE